MHSDTVPRRTPAGFRFTFAPTLAANQRGALEHLLYFNVNQQRVRRGIEKSIESYGVPEIVEKDGALSVRVGTMESVETLFAISEFGHPLGIAVFARLASPERFVVLHVGVLPKLRSSSDINAQALLELIHEVHRIARHRQGIDRIEMAYSQREIPKAVLPAS